MDAEERIIELESRIAHQDRIIADLDDVVREFAGRVTALERTVGELRQALHAEPGTPGEAPPREG